MSVQSNCECEQRGHICSRTLRLRPAKNLQPNFGAADSCGPEHGATMLEMAIVLPVFILLILAFIDFARYVSVKTVLNTGAARALTIASIAPGLVVDTELPGVDLTRQNEVLNRVRRTAKQLASSTLVSETPTSMIYFDGDTEVELPTRAGTGLSIEDAYRTTPITVSIKASMVPVLPLLRLFRADGTIGVQGVATGFREIATLSSNPIPTDCLGRPIGSADYFQDCPCQDETREHWDSSSRTCVCSGQLVGEAGSCACPDGAVPDPNDSTRCVCADAGKVIRNGQCVCPGQNREFIDGRCQCAPGYNPTGTASNNCQCDWRALNCGPLEYADSETCQCQCDRTREGANCECKSTHHDVGERRCECNNSSEAAACRARVGFAWNFVECRCQCSTQSCPPGQSLNGDCQCQCDNPLMELRGRVCQCIGTAPVGQHFDSSCRAVCDGTNAAPINGSCGGDRNE